METDIVKLQLKDGEVLIRLRRDLAPNHCQLFLALVEGGFYNTLKWHRVIDKFMAQTGCPFGNGVGGCGFNIPAEFTDTPFVRGTVGMARVQDPNSASSQFFICLDDAPFLNGQYTVFGQVVQGMEFVDNIKKGDPTKNGVVDNADIVVSMSPVYPSA